MTRKITRRVAEIKLGKDLPLYLGNLDAKRDWGHAKDYVDGMWKILQHDEPEDFVLATGETHTVREFVELAFNCIDIKIVWNGSGLKEVGYCHKTEKPLVHVNPKYFRPTEVDILIGDPKKAKEKLGLVHTTSFENLVSEMVAEDINLLSKMK